MRKNKGASPRLVPIHDYSPYRTSKRTWSIFTDESPPVPTAAVTRTATMIQAARTEISPLVTGRFRLRG